MKVFHNFEWTEILCWPNQINSTSSSPMLAFVDIDWMSVFLYFYWREFYFIRSPAATFYSGSYGDFSVTRWRRVDWCRARMPMWPKFLRKKKTKKSKKKRKRKTKRIISCFSLFFSASFTPRNAIGASAGLPRRAVFDGVATPPP